MSAAPALELRGIVKRFGLVEALAGADFSVEAGEVHALLGENGAGKSTLISIAYGMVHADAGTIRLAGDPRQINSPRDARRLGIGMVHQHFTSVPSLTVAENIAVAAGWPIAPRQLRTRVAALAERVGMALDPDVPVSELNVAMKQRLEILKALATDARILLLDEPTAVLAPAETEEFLAVVRRYAERGNAAVLITHKLDEALATADRVTVLRRGAVVLSGRSADQSPASLAEAMIGDRLPGERRGVSARAGGELLVDARGLWLEREHGRGWAARDMSLRVRGGEIVGLAGVEGSGQRELLRAIAGLIPVARGTLSVSGPVAFIAEDRTTEGLVPALTLAENLVLGGGDEVPWIRGRRVRWGAARRRMSELIDQFGISAPGPDAAAGSLSGGNQQKVVIARALERAPRVIVAENPTRGLDIRAANEVHERLRSAAAGGAAVVFSSGDLDEVLALADRIAVSVNGTLLDAPPSAGRVDIGAMMLPGAST
jgi:general nucleoside transport system ATP-binding protein